MEGLVFDIKRGVTKDGPGLRTSVFLKGCPLRCAWCHNPESQSLEPERAVTTGELCGRRMTIGKVMEEVCRDKVFYAASGGGLTLTGGEPLMQPKFAAALAEAARAEGIHVALDTSGFASWAVVARFIPAVDLFLYDLKCMDPAKHRELTGVDNALILDNLRRLDDAGARFWIRCPLVPGQNDTDADLSALRDFTATLHHAEKIEICPYHPLGLEKYAKFGKTPPYVRHEAASDDDVARWKHALYSPLARSPVG